MSDTRHSADSEEQPDVVHADISYNDGPGDDTIMMDDGNTTIHAEHIAESRSIPTTPPNRRAHRINPFNEAIPSDPDSFMQFYNTPRNTKVKRDRSNSPESRESKVHRRSTSHSTARSTGPSVPSTKYSSRVVSRSSRNPSRVVSCSSHNPSVSPVDEIDPQGSSRTTGGHFRGKATGNHFNFADSSEYY